MLLSILTFTLLLGSRQAFGQEDCTVFKAGACPLEESNIIGNSGEATNAAECQVRIVFSYLKIFKSLQNPLIQKCAYDKSIAFVSSGNVQV